MQARDEPPSYFGRLCPLPGTGNRTQPRVLTLGFVPNRMRPEGTPAEGFVGVSWTWTCIVGPMTISTDIDKLYDTDLTDAGWTLIAPMLPAARPRNLCRLGSGAEKPSNLIDGPDGCRSDSSASLFYRVPASLQA